MEEALRQMDWLSAFIYTWLLPPAQTSEDVRTRPCVEDCIAQNGGYR